MTSQTTLYRAELKGADGSTATVHAQGATLTSWKTSDGVERLFVSSKAKYQAGAAIRGGVPICWPQFAMRGPLAQQHGFARNSTWAEARRTPHSVVFRLDQEIANLPVTLGSGSLTQELRVTNRGQADLPFTAALHTYLGVASLAEAGVEGLTGLQYQDNTSPGSTFLEDSAVVGFPGEVDRLYVGAPDQLTLRAGAGRTLRVAKRGFPDAVVWNPAAAKASGMADLSDWKGFVCVEVAYAAGDPVVLLAGQSWAASQILSAL